MARLPGPIAAVLTAAVSIGVASSIVATTASTSVGCAMSPPADLTPGPDPTLPGLDAASIANPAMGIADATDAATSSGADADANEKTGDSGTSGSSGTSGTSGSSGTDAAPPVPKPSAGEILITEVMYTTNTPEPASEWIELYNAAPSPRALAGLVLKDGGGRTHLIAQAVVIAPGEYMIFARSKAGAIAAKVPAAAIAYEYGAGLSDTVGVLLANGATGGISLLNSATVVAAVPYGGWFTQSGGASIQAKALDATSAGAKTGWCLSATAWTSGSDKGTPGVASDCP